MCAIEKFTLIFFVYYVDDVNNKDKIKIKKMWDEIYLK